MPPPPTTTTQQQQPVSRSDSSAGIGAGTAAAALVSQARQSANRLIDEAQALTLFRWLDEAGDEGRELYNRVRQLQEIVRDVGVALRRREEQLQGESGGSSSSGGGAGAKAQTVVGALAGGVVVSRPPRGWQRDEDVVWKNAEVQLVECQRLLNQLRKLLLGWGGDAEPTRAQTLALQVRLSLVQRRKITALHRKLGEQFEGLQMTIQALNMLMQVDTHKRIGVAQEKVEETNANVGELSEMIRQISAQLQAMDEQQKSFLHATQGASGSPALSPNSAGPTTPVFDLSQATTPRITLSRERLRTSVSGSRLNVEPPIIRPRSSSTDHPRDIRVEADHTLERQEAGRTVPEQPLQETPSIPCDPSASRRGSSVALETNYTDSDVSNSEHNPRNRRRLSSTANQRVTFAMAGDYSGGIAQFLKKPKEDYDDLLVEYNERAKLYLKQKKYDLAEHSQTQAIQIARNRKEFYDTPFDELGMQDRLGQIYLHGKRFKKALDIWLQLLPRVNDPDQIVTLQHCHHFHLVAEVYYRMWRDTKQRGLDEKEDLLDALKNADSAYNKRCEIVGPTATRTSPEVRLTADLLARIHDALGNSAEARFYQTRADGIVNPALDSFDLPHRDDDGELAQGQKANTELLKAVRDHNVPRALALLKNQALEFDLERPVGREASKGRLTILMLAFEARSEPIVKALLERGADIAARDEEGRTAVHRASASGDAKMAFLAVRSGKKGSLEQTDKYGFTPLLLAVAENQAGVLDVVETLLIEEANVNAVDLNEDNVVHLAARNSSKSSPTKMPQASSRAFELLRHLVTHPRVLAPINDGNGQGNTPLMLACENGHAATVELLLKTGAEIDAKNHDGQSALWLAVDEHAVMPRYEDTIRTLLHYNVSVCEKELPKKWKEFRHLAHKSAGAADSSPRPSTGHQRDTSHGSISSPPKLSPRVDARRGSSTSAATGARRGSVSTTNTTTSRGSSRISRMFSFTR